jgi:hypothetical protein
MKKQIYIIALVAIFFGGCDDFLDKKPLAQQTTDSFLSDPATAEDNFEQMLHAAYSVHTIGENTWRQSRHYFENMISDWLSDDCEKGGNGTADMPEVLTWRTWSIVPNGTSSVREGTPWLQGYLGAGRANAILEYLEAYKANLTPESYNRKKGEALFLRAYFYLNMVRVYGTFPYFDKPVTAADYHNPPKMAPADIYQRIEQDLKDAVSLLPVKSKWTTVWPGGRATKGAAEAILARTITMEIGFGFNSKTWQDVYDVTKDLINSGEYTLDPNYAHIFTAEGEMGPEAVYEIPCADFGTPYGSTGGTMIQVMTTFRPQLNITYSPSLPNTGWGFSTPTQELYNQFEPGDVRRACTMIDSGDYFMGQVIPVVIDNQCPDGFWLRKYAGTNNVRINTAGTVNIRLVRYAEVLLTHAEASYQIGQEAEALQYVNMVRDRARASSGPKGSIPGDPTGYPAPTNTLGPITATSGPALLAAIKHERRVELAIEGQRTWDLMRWNEYEDAIRSTIIPGDRFLGGTDVETVVANYESHFIPGTRVSCFPIPSDEVQNFGIEQNPGY